MSGMWLNAQPISPVVTTRSSTEIAKRVTAERLPETPEEEAAGIASIPAAQRIGRSAAARPCRDQASPGCRPRVKQLPGRHPACPGRKSTQRRAVSCSALLGSARSREQEINETRAEHE